MKIAACNIVGPDGDQIAAGLPIPNDWPGELVEELMRGGGVIDDEVDEEALKGLLEGDEQ